LTLRAGAEQKTSLKSNKTVGSEQFKSVKRLTGFSGNFLVNTWFLTPGKSKNVISEWLIGIKRKPVNVETFN